MHAGLTSSEMKERRTITHKLTELVRGESCKVIVTGLKSMCPLSLKGREEDRAAEERKGGRHRLKHHADTR